MKHFLVFFLSGKELIIGYTMLFFGFLLILSFIKSTHFPRLSLVQWLAERKWVDRSERRSANANHFGIGLIFSLAFALLTLSWTTSQPAEKILLASGEEYELEVIPPQTEWVKKKPLPPPPKPKLELIEFTNVENLDTLVELPDEIQADNEMDGVDSAALIPPPKVPLPEMDEPLEFVRFPEQMPRFPGCESDDLSLKEKKNCADKEMLSFIYENISYPRAAVENRIEGTVVIRFIVEKDGSVNDAQIVRDIGAGTGAEALRVVRLMKEEEILWTPGKQRGRPVRVQFTLPVKFKLQ